MICDVCEQEFTGKQCRCGWKPKPVLVRPTPRPFVLLKYADPREGAYNDFRMHLIAGLIGTGDEQENDHRSIVRRHAEDLGKWLMNPVNTDWAAKQPQGDCGHCADWQKPSHTLLACITAEQRYWAERLAGKTERQAKEAVGV